MKNVLKVLLGLVLVGVAGYLLYFAITYLFGLFSSLEKEVAAAIVAAMGTVLASVGATLFAQRRANLRKIDETYRQKKIVIYGKFMDIFMELQRNTLKGDDYTQEEISEKYLDRFLDFSKDVLIWSGPKFIKAYERFRHPPHGQADQLLFLVDDVLKEIRNELNISNFGLQRGELVRSLLKDPTEMDRLLSTKAE